MAFITLNRNNLRHNYRFLDSLFSERKIEWGVVSKLLCGSREYIRELINLGAREIHDSRISNLKVIKSIAPDVQTVYIKPPARRSISNVIRYADISFNTEFYTISLLNEEARKHGKIHRIIIMIEMGDLREGVMGEDLVEFYGKVLALSHIRVIGIGTNLNCLNGVMPTQDKLIQLSLYKQLIEARFNVTIPWVSGGTSVAVPLILKKIRPMAVNHFRVGEALFFGNDLFTGKPIRQMKTDVFKLFAEIIEITEKPDVPIGERGENPSGEVTDIAGMDPESTSHRAILDIGLLDIQPQYLIPEDDDIEIINASSDMLVINLGAAHVRYNVGDVIPFRLKYMGALSLLNSDYIEKQIA